MDYAYSTNAKIPGVVIVPGPMGTGGGYLYSALEAVREARGFSHEKLVEGLIVAAGLGAIAFTHAHASGESGCVGESGVCCAMASGAVTWMAGGTGEQVQHAASMALQANIGIPCDPIPGGLEFPCLTRTVRAAVTAPMYADMALSGVDPLIPYHEVLFAIEKNRQENQKAVSGPLCGVNCTLTAQKCALFLKDEVMGDKLKYTAPAL
jgi:L-serine dehydratase